MPVRDAEATLVAALRSVERQTERRFECIVVDDGSRDGSLALAREQAARDPRFRVIAAPRAGLVEALRAGLAACLAPLVARMDADDLSRPDRFAKQIAYLRRHPDIAAVSGAMDVIDDGGAYLRTDVFPTLPGAIASELIHRNCFCHAPVMARTALLRSSGGYRRNVQYAEDYDLWLRLSEVAPLANLPDVLYSVRLHQVTISTRHTAAQELAVLAARGAARLRRAGKADPLGGAAGGVPLGYRAVQQMFAASVPRAEFALSFFRTVLGRTTEQGSIAEWSKLYLRHGLWDLDRDGAALMMLLLGHNMLRRRRADAPLRALAAYPAWAVATAMVHPVAALRVALDARRWIELARARLLQPAAL